MNSSLEEGGGRNLSVGLWRAKEMSDRGSGSSQKAKNCLAAIQLIKINNEYISNSKTKSHKETFPYKWVSEHTQVKKMWLRNSSKMNIPKPIEKYKSK